MSVFAITARETLTLRPSALGVVAVSDVWRIRDGSTLWEWSSMRGMDEINDDDGSPPATKRVRSLPNGTDHLAANVVGRSCGWCADFQRHQRRNGVIESLV